jgi:hypothetical protein
MALARHCRHSEGPLAVQCAEDAIHGRAARGNFLNGRFAVPKDNPFAGAKNLRELWLKLLLGANQPGSAKEFPSSDAPAMVRRVSP